MDLGYKYSSLEEDKIKLILSFLYPFGAYLYAFKNIGSKTSLIVLYIFYLFYGWTFTPRNKDLDSYRYAEDFHSAQFQYSQEGVRGIIENWKDDDIDSETEKDLFVPITNYYLTKVVDNAHFLFLLYAALFGGFMVLSLRYVVTLPTFRNDLAGLVLVFMFLFSNPIFNINGIRFWLAGWVATYSVFKILAEKKHIYLLLLFSTYFIHISYSIYIVLALIACVISNIKGAVKVLPVVFFISFFVSSFAAELINSFEPYFPPIIQQMISAYLDEYYVAERSSMFAGYAKVLNSLPHVLWNVMLMLIIINKHRELSSNKIYAVVLILLSFSNFMMAVPSVGVRFIQLCVPFVVYLWVQTMADTKWHKYIKYTPVLYCYTLLYWFRNTVSISNPFLYLTNSIHLIIKNFIQ